MSYLSNLVSSLWYILPAYFANASPVVLGGGKPIDFGFKLWDGQRIFGDHKTFRGMLSGLLVGTLIGTIQGRELTGFIQGLGAMTGDLTGSFIKRRLGRKPGQWTPIIDEESFLLVALLASNFVEPVSIEMALILVLITPFLHIMTNRLKDLLILGVRKHESGV